MDIPPNREVELFSAALELDDSLRAAYLQEACADDLTLRLHIEELLQVHEKAITFLEMTASGAREDVMANKLPGSTEASSRCSAEKAGDQTGRYKLLQQIGEGGCGVVYMAEQGEPVRRKVALKIIKLGMDTEQVIARFEAERQALALMDHPCIAKVFDAGATDTGRPYFVMELVRGKKITDYCDQNRLSTRDRLRLFTQVCDAIQHAHQKGIIHRDIKPSNILVTVTNPGGPGCPKIIDFGIAKATSGQRLTDKTLFTAFEQFIGTPAYMSPEQAMMTNLDVDTRTDIYALGVLLYELLTGQTPFDAKEMMAAGLDAMRRIIREQEPLRPSTRLSTLLAEDLTSVALARQAEPARLGSLLRGDLDWIVMKALEKDRTRRYETANGLAQDVERFLADEPVAARPPSRAYQFQKLVRRNRGVFAALCVVGLVLVLGVAASTWQATRARRAERQQERLKLQAEAEKKKAQIEAGKSGRVADLLKQMLRRVGPSKALGRDTTMLQEILDETASGLGKDLTNQPEVEVELRLTLASTYRDLGLYQRMEEMARQSLQLARTRLGGTNESVAKALMMLGDALWALNQPAEVGNMYREALARRRQLLGNEHLEVADSLDRVAKSDLTGKLPQQEAARREALAIRRRVLGDKDPEVAASLSSLAHVVQEEGKMAELKILGDEAQAIRQKLSLNENPDTARALYHLAQVLAESNLAEAEVMQREALAMQRKLFGDEHPEVATSLRSLAGLLRAQGKLLQAEGVFREALSIRKRLFGDAHPSAVHILWDLAVVLQMEGKIAEIEPIYREALDAQTGLFDDAIPDQGSVAINIMYQLMSLGRFDAIEKALNETLTPDFQLNPRSIGLLRSRARFFVRRGRWKEASADLTKALALNPTDPLTSHLLAVLLVAGGDLESYGRLRHKSLELLGTTTDPEAAGRLARDCLILPCSGLDLEIAARLAEIGVNAATNYPDMSQVTLVGVWESWIRFTKGLAEYRQGRPADAFEWMQRVLSEPGQEPNRVAAASVVLAMAQNQLKQSDKARTSLAKAFEIANTKMPKLASGDLGNDWADWIIVQALFTEAKALIEGQNATTKGL